MKTATEISKQLQEYKADLKQAEIDRGNLNELIDIYINKIAILEWVLELSKISNDVF